VHELSITRNMVAIVAEHAAGQRVRRVRLEVGRLSAVMPDALRFCFDICAQGTAAEGAELEIIEIAGRARCRACGDELELDDLVGCCPACGSAALSVIAGEELNIKEMEVEKCV
jgi:hydrogenase nickel incorporation protein HypA/HybF